MYRKQLGRRNLSDEQKTYLLGKLYEARKQTRGGTGANQYNVQNRQNGDSAKGRTVIQIAKEQGVGQKTVERAEHFAKGLDAIREVHKKAYDAEKMQEKFHGNRFTKSSEFESELTKSDGTPRSHAGETATVLAEKFYL